jgi:hypothetical protein
VVKYQNCIKDLVDHYGARTILDYGCGKGQQYTDPLPYAGEHNWQTFDAYLGVSVYRYDPCVAGLETPPPAGTKFDGVICTQVTLSFFIITDQKLINLTNRLPALCCHHVHLQTYSGPVLEPTCPSPCPA